MKTVFIILLSTGVPLSCAFVYGIYKYLSTDLTPLYESDIFDTISIFSDITFEDENETCSQESTEQNPNNITREHITHFVENPIARI
jgi:hypothetical protein